jgi:hypothetical protein
MVLARTDSTGEPGWISITTAALSEKAAACYHREAHRQGSAYCASAIEDVVTVVWASCFDEEESLLLAAIEDSDNDQAGMSYLASIEDRSRPKVLSIVREAQASADGCRAG